MKKSIFLFLFLSAFCLPKSIWAQATININSGETGQELTITMYADSGYTLDSSDWLIFEENSFQQNYGDFYSDSGTMINSREMQFIVDIPKGADIGSYSLGTSYSRIYLPNIFTVFSSLSISTNAMTAGNSYSVYVYDNYGHFPSDSNGIKAYLEYQDFNISVKIIATNIQDIDSNSFTCTFNIPKKVSPNNYNLWVWDSTDWYYSIPSAVHITNILKVSPNTITAGEYCHLSIKFSPGALSNADSFVYIGNAYKSDSVRFIGTDSMVATFRIPDLNYDLPGNDLDIYNFPVDSLYYGHSAYYSNSVDTLWKPSCISIIGNWNLSPTNIYQGQKKVFGISDILAHFNLTGTGISCFISMGDSNKIPSQWVKVITKDSIIAGFNIPLNAKPGLYDINIIDSIDGEINCYGVISVDTSLIANVSPNSGRIGETVNMSIVFSGFWSMNPGDTFFVELKKDWKTGFVFPLYRHNLDTGLATFRIPKYVAAGAYDMYIASSPNSYYYLDSLFLYNAFTIKTGNVLNGFIYDDHNHNGQFDVGEKGAPAVNIEVQPGNNITSTDDSGYFSFGLDSGIYTVTPQLPAYADSIHDKTASVSFAGFTGKDSLSFGVSYKKDIYDPAIDLATFDWARRGSSLDFWITAKNNGTDTAHATIKFLANQIFKYQSESGKFNIIPTKRGDTIIWKNVKIAPRQTITDLVTTTVGIYVTDKYFKSNVWVSSLEHDTNLTNNHDSAYTYIVGSHDPNSKSVMPPNYIPSNPIELKYTVNFQNTGNDTAFRVIIEDTLDKSLNIKTFRIISASHSYRYYIEGNLLTVVFNNILLPDSTVNEPMSKGFIKYGIMPDSGMALNSTVSNTAGVYFDYNEPVITNNVVNTVNNDSFYHTVVTGMQPLNYKSDGQVSLYPNPAQNELTIDADGSFIKTLTISDITGKELYFISNLNSTKLTIPVSNLQNGLYFIKVSLDDGDCIGKFIKK